MALDRGKLKYLEKNIPGTLCPQQISHRLNLGRHAGTSASNFPHFYTKYSVTVLTTIMQEIKVRQNNGSQFSTHGYCV